VIFVSSFLLLLLFSVLEVEVENKRRPFSMYLGWRGEALDALPGEEGESERKALRWKVRGLGLIVVVLLVLIFQLRSGEWYERKK
jgi:hypothetical protein